MPASVSAARWRAVSHQGSPKSSPRVPGAWISRRQNLDAPAAPNRIQPRTRRLRNVDGIMVQISLHSHGRSYAVLFFMGKFESEPRKHFDWTPSGVFAFPETWWTWGKCPLSGFQHIDDAAIAETISRETRRVGGAELRIFKQYCHVLVPSDIKCVLKVCHSSCSHLCPTFGR
jgi:hypothetical protein